LAEIEQAVSFYVLFGGSGVLFGGWYGACLVIRMENLLNLEKLSEVTPVAMVITTHGSHPPILCPIAFEATSSTPSFSWK